MGILCVCRKTKQKLKTHCLYRMNGKLIKIGQRRIRIRIWTGKDEKKTAG